MADLADTLRTIPLFSALSREDIAKVLGKLEERSFAAGTIQVIKAKGDREALSLVAAAVPAASFFEVC